MFNLLMAKAKSQIKNLSPSDKQQILSFAIKSYHTLPVSAKRKLWNEFFAEQEKWKTAKEDSMVTLADIRRFKRMQKEYRKLSGMGAIVATGFGPGGAIPYSRKTVGRLWWEVGASGENPAQGVEEFWSILRERFPRTYDQMHNWLSSNGWKFLYHDPFGDVPSRLATIEVVEAFGHHPLEPGSLYGLGEVGGPLGESVMKLWLPKFLKKVWLPKFLKKVPPLKRGPALWSEAKSRFTKIKYLGRGISATIYSALL